MPTVERPLVNPSFPDKASTLANPVKKVKRWRVWIGTTSYRPMTLEKAAAFARQKMWGGSQVITIEPVMVVVIPRRRST